MADAIDTHDANCVGNFVNNAVVADANSPVVLSSREFAADRSTWTWYTLFFRQVREDILQWAVMKRFAAGFLQPGHILHVLQSFHHLSVILDGQDD